MSTTTVAAHGLHASLPHPWEGRLYLRDQPGDTLAAPPRRLLASRAFRAEHPAAYGNPGESMNPVLHLANFALPPGRGDFGTGAVEIMAAHHVFASLLEYDAEEAGRPLFAAQGMPRLRVHDFAPNALQRRLPGQLGTQKFFTANGRAFCLYVVLGSRQHAPSLVDQTHGVVSGIVVSGATAGGAVPGGAVAPVVVPERKVDPR